MNTKRAPKVRFKGFTDAWELRKLPEFVNFYSGLTYTPDNVQESGTLVLRSSNVKNGEIIDADNVYVNIDIVNSENVQDGDIIVVIRNGSRALIGKHAQIKGFRSNTVIGAFMTGIRSEHPAFVNALLDTPAFEIEIAKNLGATINQITGYMFSKMEFAIPSSKEQIEIGKFFLNLDNLITLHQRKLDKMKELKKAFLNLIFSQKLRFRGFDQSWRKLKIEDCFSERVERSEKGELISVTVNFGIVKAHSLYRKDNSSENKSNYKIVRKDDIAYNSMRMWQGASGISLYEGILSPAYTVIVPKQGVSSLFFSYEFKLKKMLQTFQVNSQGLTSDTWNLKFPLLRNIVVEAPEYEEQEKVGIFFKKLDNLITHHQDKINQLTKLKTTFLKNMFI